MADPTEEIRARRFDVIAGLDLSLTSTGLAKIGAGPGRRPFVRTIESTGKKTDDWAARHARLSAITAEIMVELPHDPDTLVVLEGPSYASTTGSQHDRSGLWWLLYDLLRKVSHTVVVVPPTTRAKYATGKGTAAKAAVLAATVRRHPDIPIDCDDIADAVNLMAIGCRLSGVPFDDPLPKVNLSALEKLSIPKGAWRG